LEPKNNNCYLCGRSTEAYKAYYNFHAHEQKVDENNIKDLRKMQMIEITRISFRKGIGKNLEIITYAYICPVCQASTGYPRYNAWG
jgi:hypothetical protein